MGDAPDYVYNGDLIQLATEFLKRNYCITRTRPNFQERKLDSHKLLTWVKDGDIYVLGLREEECDPTNFGGIKPVGTERIKHFELAPLGLKLQVTIEETLDQYSSSVIVVGSNTPGEIACSLERQEPELIAEGGRKVNAYRKDDSHLWFGIEGKLK